MKPLTSPAVKVDVVATSQVKNNYLSHKSVTLEAEKVEIIGDNSKADNLPLSDKTVVSTASVTSGNNYLSHKTVTIEAEKNPEKSEDKPKENKLVSSDTTAASNNSFSNNNYLSHKTVIISDQIISENTAEKPIESNRNSNGLNSSYPQHRSVSISSTDATSTSTIDNKPETEQQKTYSSTDTKAGSYPSNKTVWIGEEGTAKVITEEVKINSVVTSEIKSDTTERTNGLTRGNYASHKTFSFNIEESSSNSAGERIVSDTTGSRTGKEETATSQNIKAQAVLVATKSKKPFLWIILSTVFFLTTAVTVFLSFKQQHALKEEVAQLKLSNEDLTEGVKRYQKDIHIDDIITSAIKFNPKNEIILVTDANGAEALRVCFSVGANLSTKKGKKEVYFRFITSDNKVLTKEKENTFEYRGNQIPFSFKANVEFKGQDLMVCFDYKLEEKLVKGEYKAEIYNEGVLDGTVKFELK